MGSDLHSGFGMMRKTWRGLWRMVVGSIAMLAGGLVFVICFLGFEAPRLPWYENAAVVLSAFILVPLILIGMWVGWALAMGRHFHRTWKLDLDPF